MGVALFALGGTVSVSGARGAGQAGGDGRLTGAQIVASVPGLAGLGVALDVHDTRMVASGSLAFADLLEVVGAAERAVREGACGVVVTQGTDTLEEAAFLADLLWPHEEPLVFTGAMRNPSLAGADGPANVLAAVRVAAAPPARGLGALVAFNDEVHAARWVRKAHSTSTAAFASPNAGPIGRLSEGRLRMLSAPPRRPPLPRPIDADRLQAARVAVYCAALDDHGDLLDGVTDRHRGLVVAAFGGGHVPASLAPRLGDLAERIPVVLTSRTLTGSVLRETYHSPGSETDLLRRGLVDGGLLDPYKARVLLRLLLAAGVGRKDIAAAFARHG